MPHADQDNSIIWRMAGAGTFQLIALGADGRQLAPRLGYQTGGSTWQRPGDKWASVFVFPSSGCWQMRATRDGTIGTIWLTVLP
jgi:hypothetical protein